jgi:hypothetical protein
MGRIKAWMMDMEDCVHDAVSSGLTSTDEVVDYVRGRLKVVDESYVENYHKDFINMLDSNSDILYNK